MLGIISGFVLLFQVGSEHYNNKKDTPEKAKQREKEQCDKLGIEPFDVRLKMIMDQVEWRKKNGIS